MIDTIRKDIHCSTKTHAWILDGLIPCPPKDAKNIDEACDSAFGTVLSQPRNLEITGPGLKWDCADGFQRQCYPVLGAWVGDYPEQVMIAQFSYGSGPMCEIPKGVSMGHSAFRPLDNSRDEQVYSELLEDNYIDALDTLGVNPKSATSSGNTLCAMSIGLGSLMNCISCSWV